MVDSFQNTSINNNLQTGTAGSLGGQLTPTPGVCPGCGRCKTCGQPNPYPQYGYPYYPYWNYYWNTVGTYSSSLDQNQTFT